jgi:hypothetical protein
MNPTQNKNIKYSDLPPNIIEAINRVEMNKNAANPNALEEIRQNMEMMKAQMNPVMRMQLDNLEEALRPLQETMQVIAEKESPETPDFSEPVVEAIDELSKTWAAALRGINVKPQVNVEAPNVNVAPPEIEIDLSKVERVLKSDMPKAFEAAIAKLPKVEIPEQDDSEILSKLDSMLEQLKSIDTASRMKPQAPNTIKVVNPDGTAIGGSSAVATTVYNGQTNVTTAGTRVALASSQAVKSVVVKAKRTNTGLIYVGSSTVSSSNGFILGAGDSVSLDIANLATVYIDSSVNGEGVSYAGTN